jgi:hypothetical protein
MKTFLKYAAIGGLTAFLLSKAYGADVSPGLPLGRPLQNGDNINAAVLNGSLNGTINPSFYTGKAFQGNPSSANDIILMFNNSSGIYEYTTYGQFLVNTNLIAGRTPYTSGISNSFSLLVLDNAGQILGQTTISNLLYYGLQMNTNQFALATNSIGTFTLYSISNAVFTNVLITNFVFQGNVTNGTMSGTTITNCSTSNYFTIGGNSSGKSSLRFYDSSGAAGARAWDWSLNTGGQMMLNVWDDGFSNPGGAIMTITRGVGNTNVQAVNFTISSNGVNQIFQIVPAGVSIGSGNAIAQVNTYDSGTNNAIPAAGGAVTKAHGFPLCPTEVRAVYVNVTGELGYSAGDEIDVKDCLEKTVSYQIFQVVCDGTNVTLRRKSTATTIEVLNKGTGVIGDMTEANWKMRIYAKYVK